MDVQGDVQSQEQKKADYIQSLIPTFNNAGELRSKILGTLVLLHGSRSVSDIESLAHDIWIEAWEHHTPCTYTFIRHRLINRYHHDKRDHLRLEELSKLPPITQSDLFTLHDRLDQVFKLACPSGEELQVVFAIYYSGLTFEQASLSLHLSQAKIKHTLESVLDRLQKAGRWVEAQELSTGELS